MTTDFDLDMFYFTRMRQLIDLLGPVDMNRGLVLAFQFHPTTEAYAIKCFDDAFEVLLTRGYTSSAAAFHNQFKFYLDWYRCRKEEGGYLP